jgi:hypothetical protein
MERYTNEMQPPTTPASLEAMARTLDEIRGDVKLAVKTATEAREFARKSSESATKIASAASLPLFLKAAIIFAGSAVGGFGASLVIRLVSAVI